MNINVSYLFIAFMMVSLGTAEFEHADPQLRSLHYVAGGHLHAIGDALDVMGNAGK